MAFQSDRRIRQVIAIQIDPNFLRQLSAGQQAAVQVIADGRQLQHHDAALGYVGSAVESFNADWRTTTACRNPDSGHYASLVLPHLENRLSARDPDTDRRHKLFDPKRNERVTISRRITLGGRETGGHLHALFAAKEARRKWNALHVPKGE